MPSSYTASARFVLQATGEGTNVWGTILNSGAFQLIDFNVNGTVTISATGATMLTTANGSTDQARAAILNYTGATAGTLTIPSVSKVYQVRAATASCIVTNGSNSVTVEPGDVRTVLTDGSSVWLSQQTNFAGARLKNIGTPTANTDAVTKLYADQLALDTFSGDVPGQASNEGKVWTTNGTSMAFQYPVADQTGAAGKYLRSTGVNPDGTGEPGEWAFPLAEPQRKTANYTAVNQDRLECDTTAGPFTVTLPEGEEGDIISLWDGGVTATARGFADDNLTVVTSGSDTVNGFADEVIFSSAGFAGAFEFLNSTWRFHLGSR